MPAAVLAPESTWEQNRLNLRRAVTLFYDIQKLRVAQGNRANPEVDTSYLTDREKGWFQSGSDFLLEAEKSALRAIRSLNKRFAVHEWTLSIKGVGPAITGNLLSTFDPFRADTASKFWAYCGLHTVDGKAPKLTRGTKANWNTHLRAKMVGVLGTCLLRAQNEHYCPIYYQTKERYNNQDPVWGTSDGHRNRSAIRIMVKALLLDFWVAWRTILGLPIRSRYAVEYLKGSEHPVFNQDMIDRITEEEKVRRALGDS